jgi:hypothetical protein
VTIDEDLQAGHEAGGAAMRGAAGVPDRLSREANSFNTPSNRLGEVRPEQPQRSGKQHQVYARLTRPHRGIQGIDRIICGIRCVDRSCIVISTDRTEPASVRECPVPFCGCAPTGPLRPTDRSVHEASVQVSLVFSDPARKTIVDSRAESGQSATRTGHVALACSGAGTLPRADRVTVTSEPARRGRNHGEQ